MRDSCQTLGRMGEDAAFVFLQRLGYDVIQRNWRCSSGEIDIVAMEGDTLVAVEVRSRRGRRFGRPAESLNRRKQERMANCATHLVLEMGWQGPWRIDVVTVEWEKGFTEPSLAVIRSAVEG